MILGIGIDICEIARIERLYARYGERMVRRLLGAQEQMLLAGRAHPAQFLAGRFAAKEAVMKALGSGWSGGVHYPAIEILRGPRGRPEVHLHGGAAELAAELGGTRWHITITHDAGLAMAQAILEGDDPPLGSR